MVCRLLGRGWVGPSGVGSMDAALPLVPGRRARVTVGSTGRARVRLPVRTDVNRARPVGVGCFGTARPGVAWLLCDMNGGDWWSRTGRRRGPPGPRRDRAATTSTATAKPPPAGRRRPDPLGRGQISEKPARRRNTTTTFRVVFPAGYPLGCRAGYLQVELVGPAGPQSRVSCGLPAGGARGTCRPSVSGVVRVTCRWSSWDLQALSRPRRDAQLVGGSSELSAAIARCSPGGPGCSCDHQVVSSWTRSAAVMTRASAGGGDVVVSMGGGHLPWWSSGGGHGL